MTHALGKKEGGKEVEGQADGGGCQRKEEGWGEEK